MITLTTLIQSYYFWTTLCAFVVSGGITAYALRRRRRGNKDTLVVGMYAEYKPFEYVDKSGEVKGYDVDYVRAVARRMNKKLHLKNISFDSLIPALQQGEIDVVISGMAITPDRLKYMDMIPYHGQPLRAFALIFWKEIPEGIVTINDIAQLRNRKVAVQVGTIQEEFINKFDFVEPKPVCSTTGLILDIRHGDSIAAVVKPDIAYAMQSEHPKVKILEVPLEQKDWILGDGIGIRKGNKALAQSVERSVMQLRENGQAQSLHKKWLSPRCCEE